MDITVPKLSVNYCDYEMEGTLEGVLLRDAALNNAALAVFEQLAAMHEGLASFTVDKRLSEEFSTHASNYENLGGMTGGGLARIYHGDSKTHKVGILIWTQEKPQSAKKNMSVMARFKKWWDKK